MRATTKLLTVLAMAAALTPMAPASAAVTDAAIADFAFSPNPVRVKVGDTVKWTNSDSSAHTVTADDNSFDSNNLSDGGAFSQTFNQAGTFPYHCDIHPSMTGTVEVAAQSTTTTTPTSTTTTAPATIATAPPTTVTTRATTTSTAPRATTTAPRPTTTVTAAPSTTVAPVAPTNPPTTEATPLPSETPTSTLVAAGVSDDTGGGSGGNAGLLAAGAALLLLAGAGGWWGLRRFRAA